MHDQYDDKSLVTLKKLSTILEFPGFVKEASIIDEKEVHNLPRSSYGDTVNRKFPLTSKKDVYLSALYFRKNASEYKDKEIAATVKRNIDNALSIWNIPHTFAKKIPNMPKKASTHDSVHIRNNSGEEIDTWELNSPRDFEKAAIQLFEHKNLFSFEQRKDIARQLLKSDLKKEAALDDNLDNYLDKAAGFGMCTKLQLINTIRDRARMYKAADYRFTDMLAEFAESLEDEALDCSHLEKTASVLDFLDKHTGIDKYKDLESPEECLFIYTEKIAQEIKDSFIKLQNGSNIEKKAIEEESLDVFFDNFLGEIPKTSFEEKLDILASLPEPDANDFEQFYFKK